MQDTIFEKIIAHEIPAEIVYEDDLVLAFLDINPINIGHTLIVPKKKFVNIFDADPDVLAHMVKTAKRIAGALQELSMCDGVNMQMNNGPAAGQEVFHAHLHVIPRFTDDGAYKRAKHVPYDSAVGKDIAVKLQETLLR